MAEITRRRVGELLRKLFEILAKEPEGLHAGKALDSLANSISLTPYEQGEYDPGIRRFDRIVRFATIDCVKAGWLVKFKGVWNLTVDGQAAMTKYPDAEDFYKEAVRLYQLWKRSQANTQSIDPVSIEAAEQSNTEKYVSITQEKAEEQAWSEIEHHLHAMLPYDFQELVAVLLKGMDYHVLWIAPPGKDGGVDIVAASDPLGTRTPKIKVQVKRTANRTDTDTVKAFVAVLDGDDVGIFVSAGGFTKDADEFARHQAKRRITLVDRRRLVELWVKFYGHLDEIGRRLLPITPIYFLTLPT